MDQVDTAALRLLANARFAWLTDLARWINTAGAGWAVSVVGLGTVLVLMVFRRWRHLLVWLGSLAILEILGVFLYTVVPRPRPFGVTIIGSWGGFSTLAPPVAAFAATLVGMVYTILVPGRPRWYGKLWAIGLVATFALARLYLAVDHPSDVLLGAVLGAGIPVIMFRLFAPNEVFPVTYRRGKSAHLDVTGPRGNAIREAVRDSLGWDVLEIEPIGLEGSGGSTPLRLKVAGEPDTHVFAKLYAKNHVRADRWYKLGRMLLYGRLEDEASFQTVRRFVEYEDYTLRLLRDLELPVPKPYGIVEITPEREYLITMEFFQGAVEISETAVDDRIIEGGLQLIRSLWDAGVAHRDVKPANLMVRDSQVLLIDVFFVQVCPSPWRQAVDLANMMLVLAVQTDAPSVYRQGVKYFTPDEIAEAFAAARGVASPTQLRQFLKRDGRDLVSEFRSLVPPRRPFAVQRWSARRVVLGLALVAASVIGAIAGAILFVPVQDLSVPVPECGTGKSMILMAQAVPTATRLPCIEALPAEWSIESQAIVHAGEATFRLRTATSGADAIQVTLTSTCDVTSADEIGANDPSVRRYERSLSRTSPYSWVRLYRFPGGCVTHLFSSSTGQRLAILLGADEALELQARDTLVAYVDRQEGLALCGAGRPCSP